MLHHVSKEENENGTRMKKKKKLTWVQEMSSVSWAFLSGRGDIGVGGYVAHQSDVVLVVTW